MKNEVITRVVSQHLMVSYHPRRIPQKRARVRASCIISAHELSRNRKRLFSQSLSISTCNTITVCVDVSSTHGDRIFVPRDHYPDCCDVYGGTVFMSQAYGARCPKGTLHLRSTSSPLCLGIPFQTQTAFSSRTALDIALCYTNRLRRARLGRDLIGQIDRMFSGPPAAVFSSRTLHRNSSTMHGMLCTTGAPHAS